MSFARSSTIWIAFVLMLSAHAVAVADAGVVANAGASRAVIPAATRLVSVTAGPEGGATVPPPPGPHHPAACGFVSPRELDDVSRGIGQGFSRHFRVDLDKEAEFVSVDRA